MFEVNVVEACPLDVGLIYAVFAVGMLLLFACLHSRGRTAPWSRKEAGLPRGSAQGTGSSWYRLRLGGAQVSAYAL